MIDIPPQGKPTTAIALDGRVDIAAAAQRLVWPELRRYAYGSVYHVEAQGRLYLFTFGAVVQEGVDTLDEEVLSVLEEAVGRKFLHETEETYHVIISSDQVGSSPRVGWDQVVIPEGSPELLGAVALLLGQSAALERYEKAADELIDEALLLAHELRQFGRIPRASRAQIRRVGRFTTDRLELARLFYLIDQPEETWEDRSVAVLYNALFSNLELKERHQAVLQKLQAVENVTDSVINVWQARVSNRLEWAIVLLFVLEIVIVFL